MRRMGYRPPLLGCLLALLAAATAAQETVRVVETRAVSAEASSSGVTHDLRLHLYTFQGARWEPGDIVMAVWDAIRVLEQCSVALAGAELQLLEAPRRFHFYATPVSRELARTMKIRKPALFFVEDTHNQPAFDSEAIGRENAGTRPELVDTVWVAYGARDLPLVIAHELVHVLSDSGEHSEDPGNLMFTESRQTNTRLTDAQCRRLRERGEANGLLQRR